MDDKEQAAIQDVPEPEKWLFRNPEALAAVKRGLLDAAQGKISKIDLNTL
jgi:hypothetical protein